MPCKERAQQEARDETTKRKQTKADREERLARSKRKDKRMLLLGEAAKTRKETSQAKLDHQVKRHDNTRQHKTRQHQTETGHT